MPQKTLNLTKDQNYKWIKNYFKLKLFWSINFYLIIIYLTNLMKNKNRIYHENVNDDFLCFNLIKKKKVVCENQLK